MMPEVKQAVQGVFNHNYWLMVNDFGDTLELSCEDYEQGHFGCADKCERWEYNSWSNCVMRIRFRDKNFKINGASNFIHVESFRDEITVDKMSLPGAWRSQWLPNKRRLSDSVRMDLGINVIVSNFTDYHGDRYDDVFLSGPFVGPSFGFSFFIVSPQVGFVGYFASVDFTGSDDFRPYDTLRLVEVQERIN